MQCVFFILCTGHGICPTCLVGNNEAKSFNADLQDYQDGNGSERCLTPRRNPPAADAKPPKENHVLQKDHGDLKTSSFRFQVSHTSARSASAVNSPFRFQPLFSHPACSAALRSPSCLKTQCSFCKDTFVSWRLGGSNFQFQVSSFGVLIYLKPDPSYLIPATGRLCLTLSGRATRSVCYILWPNLPINSLNATLKPVKNSVFRPNRFKIGIYLHGLE